MAKKISITDVANAAGVGIGTVSRVLNEAGSVSPSMRRHVLEAMERLKYIPAERNDRPGPKHRRNAAEGRRTVELVVLSRIGIGWMDDQAPVYASIFDGIESSLAKANLDLAVRQIDRWPERLDPIEATTVGRIFFGTDDARQRPPGFPSELASVWVVGSPPGWFPGDVIHMDHMRIGQLAAEETVRLGHEACIYLGSSLGSPSRLGGYRADAFRYYIESLGSQVRMVIDPGILEVSRTTNRASLERIRSLLTPILKKRLRPTALCLEADMLAPAVYECLGELGVRPMADLTVITCNNEARYLKRLRPRPIVIDVQAQQVGVQAVHTLLWRLENPERPVLQIAVRPLLLR